MRTDETLGTEALELNTAVTAFLHEAAARRALPALSSQAAVN